MLQHAKAKRRGALRVAVLKEPNPADRRSYFIRVTADGLAQVRATSKAVRAAHARLHAALPRPVPNHDLAVHPLDVARSKRIEAKVSQVRVQIEPDVCRVGQLS